MISPATNTRLHPCPDQLCADPYQDPCLATRAETRQRRPCQSRQRRATFTRTMQLRVQPSHGQCSLHPNRTAVSRPVEGCVQCRALAGVRNLDLDDPGEIVQINIAISATGASGMSSGGQHAAQVRQPGRGPYTVAAGAGSRRPRRTQTGPWISAAPTRRARCCGCARVRFIAGGPTRTPPAGPLSQPRRHAGRACAVRLETQRSRCPALAGVRNLGLDDPSAGRPDSHCNSGDRPIRACRAPAARSQFASGAVRAELFDTHAVTQ